MEREIPDVYEDDELTVGSLIAQLQELDPQLPVWYHFEGCRHPMPDGFFGVEEYERTDPLKQRRKPGKFLALVFDYGE